MPGARRPITPVLTARDRVTRYNCHYRRKIVSKPSPTAVRMDASLVARLYQQAQASQIINGSSSGWTPRRSRTGRRIVSAWSDT